MPTLIPKMMTVVIELEIEPRGAREHHVIDFLKRTLEREMKRAEFATPAATKLVSMTARVVPEQTPYDG